MPSCWTACLHGQPTWSTRRSAGRLLVKLCIEVCYCFYRTFRIRLSSFFYIRCCHTVGQCPAGTTLLPYNLQSILFCTTHHVLLPTAVFGQHNALSSRHVQLLSSHLSGPQPGRLRTDQAQNTDTAVRSGSSKANNKDTSQHTQGRHALRNSGNNSLTAHCTKTHKSNWRPNCCAQRSRCPNVDVCAHTPHAGRRVQQGCSDTTTATAVSHCSTLHTVKNV
jgi:hypothetical protein